MQKLSEEVKTALTSRIIDLLNCNDDAVSVVAVILTELDEGYGMHTVASNPEDIKGVLSLAIEEEDDVNDSE